MDLKDKIKTGANAFIGTKTPSQIGVFDEALAALVALGFTQQASARALKKLIENEPSITIEAAIKQALKMM